MQDRLIRSDKRRPGRIPSSVGKWADGGGDGVFDVGRPIFGSEDAVGGGWVAGVGRAIDGVSTTATNVSAIER